MSRSRARSGTRAVVLILGLVAAVGALALSVSMRVGLGPRGGGLDPQALARAEAQEKARRGLCLREAGGAPLCGAALRAHDVAVPALIAGALRLGFAEQTRLRLCIATLGPGGALLAERCSDPGAAENFTQAPPGADAAEALRFRVEPPRCRVCATDPAGDRRCEQLPRAHLEAPALRLDLECRG